MSGAAQALAGGAAAAPAAAAPAGTGAAPGTAPGLATAPATGSMAPSTSAPVQSDWTTGFNDDLKGYVQTKGFRDPVAVLDSYRNMEKLMGVPSERLIKLPNKEDDPSWSEVYDRLGRPRDPKEYKIDVPKEIGDDKFADWAKSTFHELGISKSAGEKLAAKWTEYAIGNQKSKTADYTAKVEQENQGLKKEWGMAYDKHVSLAQQAAKAFKIDGPTIEKLEGAMGFAGVMKFFQNLGSKLGEGQYVSQGSSSGNSFGNELAPDAARGRIQNLRKDPDFVRRYTSGDIGAREEFERLHKMGFPE
jgi:hypothetical protein